MEKTILNFHFDDLTPSRNRNKDISAVFDKVYRSDWKFIHPHWHHTHFNNSGECFQIPGIHSHFAWVIDRICCMPKQITRTRRKVIGHIFLKIGFFLETFCDYLRIFQEIFTYFCTCKNCCTQKMSCVDCRMQRGSRKDLGNSQIRLMIRLQLKISSV